MAWHPKQYVSTSYAERQNLTMRPDVIGNARLHHRYVGVPGAISLYLVWWLTGSMGEKLDRIIQILEQIARAHGGAVCVTATRRPYDGSCCCPSRTLVD